VADTPPVSFRLSEDGRSILQQLAERDGIDRIDVIEQLLRKEARAVGIVPASKQEKILP